MRQCGIGVLLPDVPYHQVAVLILCSRFGSQWEVAHTLDDILNSGFIPGRGGAVCLVGHYDEIMRPR
jgi:hypothetical protein